MTAWISPLKYLAMGKLNRFTLTSAKFIPFIKERDVYYELVFSGALSDYVRLPRITDFRNVLSCWWMKTLGVPDWQTVFSLHSLTDNTSVLSFSFSLNGHYEFRVNSEVR